jgi:hypothetical protein
LYPEDDPRNDDPIANPFAPFERAPTPPDIVVEPPLMRTDADPLLARVAAVRNVPDVATDEEEGPPLASNRMPGLSIKNPNPVVLS